LKVCLKPLKTEAIYQHPKPISVKEMKWVIEEYMGHDNRLQPHSTIGYLSPVKFERERMEHLAQMEKT
jgi:transposase InsO family protein